MSLDKLHKLAGSLSKAVKDNEKVMIPFFSAKLVKANKEYPHDQTIGTISDIVNKMSDQNRMFISRGELQSLYKQLYSRGTKFAHLFAEELGVKTPVEEARSQVGEVRPDVQLNSGDAMLANALESVFNNKVALKLYGKETATKAIQAVQSNLESWNLTASKIEAATGNENFIVVQANYDTPKGITSVYVPVEVKSGKVLEPSLFMGNAGPEDLNHLSLKKYLTQYAGNKLQVRAEDILNVLQKSIQNDYEVSQTELALAKLNDSNKVATEFAGGILAQDVLDAPTNLEVAIPQADDRFEGVMEAFASSIGQATAKFGAAQVNLGKTLIMRNLRDAGVTGQISVANCNKDTIFYAVAVNHGRNAFKVPVKVANGKVLPPEVLMCNGAVAPFNAAGLQEIFKSNMVDAKMAAVASPQYNLKPSDLIENVRKAVADGNYAKAEDALNILKEANDQKAYQTAFMAYVNGLNPMEKVASSQCKHGVKSPNSQLLICGQTGLPMHKVHQDKHGNCVPAYRKNMEETYEGGYFMNQKIFT